MAVAMPPPMSRKGVRDTLAAAPLAAAPDGSAATGWPVQPGVRLQERLSRREDGKLAAPERRERRAGKLMTVNAFAA